MPAGNPSTNPGALETPRLASLPPLPKLPGGGLGATFQRNLNKFKAEFFGALGSASNAVDKNIAQPLVKAENRVKVKGLQLRQSVIDAGASAADTADKGLKAAQTGVNRLKYAYIAIVVFAVVYFLAQARSAFGSRS